MAASVLSAADPRGIQFVGFEKFSSFARTAGTQPGEQVWTSPWIKTRIAWNELIVSWNADAPPGTWLRVEARARVADRPTRFYILGLWSGDPRRHPRESVPGQKDADGDVDTDTLQLTRAADAVQVRVTLGGDAGQPPRLKFLGLCLADTQIRPPVLPPNRAAWGKTLPVPERSQMVYEGGNVWCSPTTISMMLAFWSRQLQRPELDRDVPEIVQQVHDPKWEGTGNWVFNTAYAGSFAGLRAYTARFSDVAEIEDWIARGFPVGLSVCYNRLRGRGREPSGHLVVAVGFTETGDAVINDPGTRRQVQKIFPRQNLVDAWAYKANTVYLIYPEKARLPRDRFGHWDSSVARRQIEWLRNGPRPD